MVRRDRLQLVLLYVQSILCTVGEVPRSADDTPWNPVHASSLLYCPSDSQRASPDLVRSPDMKTASDRMRTPSELSRVATGVSRAAVLRSHTPLADILCNTFAVVVIMSAWVNRC